ncbi:MAG: response regulator transcription factor [Flavobacteriales bacterium]|nr:response regulator transcription factor [Flavobacteriales bacterium]MBK6944483.1 response regulator transcription factor [Flavobacteriales bacterium]MBK7241356.1 response regulator transcription factor [Flavobacteriales bacterium]MBK9534150.1 response regulator transcription factor [Flavobacteriales bacterium]MBP9139917.1 response regulator transcription factor [Flavobacteriales bacterium]
MITAVQIDDEVNALEFLRARLNEVASEVNVLGVANNINDAEALIAEKKPQLVFLDVEMPGGTGFELLKRLGRWDFDVIFTTGHSRYAIQAIRFSALDYLLKPVQADELRAAIDRHIANRNSAIPEVQQHFLNNIEQQEENALKLTLTHGDRTHAIDPADITWCQADNNYTALHLADERRFISARTLKDYDDMLTPLGFIRVHKSSLVNRRHVDGVDGEGRVRLRNGTRVEVSRRRLEEVTRELRS